MFLPLFHHDVSDHAKDREVVEEDDAHGCQVAVVESGGPQLTSEMIGKDTRITLQNKKTALDKITMHSEKQTVADQG